MSAERYPRVLIASSEPITRENCTGITLGNIFRGWPKEKLRQLHVVDSIPDTSVCDQSRRLPPQCFPVDYCGRRFFHDILGQPIPKSGTTLGAPSIELGRLSLKRRLFMLACGLSDMGPLVIPKDTRDWIREFSPDSVYSLLGNIRIEKLALKAASIADCPIVPHFMDDWPSTSYGNAALLALPRHDLLRKLRRVIDRSPFGLAIGDRMAETFAQRYGLTFESFMNSVDESLFCNPKTTEESNGPLRFTHIGNLSRDRWRVLKRLALAIRSLRGELSIFDSQAHIAEYRKEFPESLKITWGSLTSDETFAEALRDADILLHIEASDPRIAAFKRFSVSTKIPPYMASGRPIVAIGPKGLATIELLEAVGAGLVIHDDDESALTKRIADYIGNQELREQHARAGHAYARERFTRAATHEAFRRAMAGVASE